MPASESTHCDSSPIWFLGTIPPPVTGHTLLTEQVLLGLQQAGPVKFLNWSPGMSRRGLRFRATRVSRLLASIVRLLWHGRRRGAPLYVVANSKAGLYLTALVVLVGSRLGYRVMLHHHTYYYIDAFDWRMAWIDRTMGPQGTHVVHCEQMAQDYAGRYPTKCGFAYVYPSVVAAPLGVARREPHVPLRLGHLSNLWKAKGLDLVLATLGELLARGRQVQLTLAGPFHDAEARRLVEQAVAEHPGAIEYVGPVYDQAKAAYFQRIDCFLFPSRSESWGIVLHEAMAAGVPVIAMRRGCTPTVVGQRAGLIVDREADFIRLATQQIEAWQEDAADYATASQAAIEQATYLQEEGRRTLGQFAKRVFSGPSSAAG